MKDYYYILGIHKKATLTEIQQAYKKLSLKFHPDKNEQDPFFVMHYEKIQEAYQVLSDEDKRFRYDRALGQDISEEVDRILEGPAPVIASFFTSKQAGQKGDLLTISWEVLHAEEVYINLIGAVAANGTQTIRLVEEAPTEEFLIIELTASNTTSDKVSSKQLKIKNLAYSPKKAALKRKQKAAQKDPNSPASKKRNSSLNKARKASVKEEAPDAELIQRRNGSGTAILLVVVMVFIILVMLYSLHSINPMF